MKTHHTFMETSMKHLRRIIKTIINFGMFSKEFQLERGGPNKPEGPKEAAQTNRTDRPNEFE